VVDDIRLQLSFKNHRKRRKLNALLSLQPSGTDYLLDLWLSTAQNHPEGKLKDMDELDIALEAGWIGDPKQFVEALMEARLLEKNGECFALHDWAENQPWVFYSKKRSKTAKNNALKRYGNQQVTATGMQTACKRHKGGHAPSPSPSPSPSPKEPAVAVPPSKHFKDNTGELREQIETHCATISKLPPKKKFNPWQFVQGCANRKQHPVAIEYVLAGLIKAWPTIGDPWPYANAAIKIESPKRYALDADKMGQIEKREWEELVNNLKAFKERKL